MATGRWAAGAARAAYLIAGRAARTAVVAFLLVVVALGAALAISRLMGYRTLTVQSGSMTGTADVGSVVVARSIAAADVRVGDVIVIQRERQGAAPAPVLHRVIERRVDTSGQIVIRTQGDANPAPDPELQVLRGRTLTPVVIVPRLGGALATVQTPVGWFGLVVLPLVAAVSFSLCRLWAGEAEGEGGDR
jgi:signal peptidase